MHQTRPTRSRRDSSPPLIPQHPRSALVQWHDLVSRRLGNLSGLLVALACLSAVSVGCSDTPEEIDTPTEDTPTANPTSSPVPTASPAPLDEDGDGYEASEDCDDLEPGVYPGATEICDQVDNDCDEGIDEGVALTLYADQDLDGFGDSSTEFMACQMGIGMSNERGDCDDTNSDVYPGAMRVCTGYPDFPPDMDCDGFADKLDWYFPDSDGDGYGDSDRGALWCNPPLELIPVEGDCNDLDAQVFPTQTDPPGDERDADCGGTPEQDVCVGEAPTCVLDLQEGLDAAPPGTTVFVGPGAYLASELSFHGKALRVVATHGPIRTNLSPSSQERTTVVVFQEGEQETSLLRGFAITHGVTGIYIQEANPVLDRLLIAENSADAGAGLTLMGASPTLNDLEISHNRASDPYEGGGGIFMYQSHPTLRDCRIWRNAAAGTGGGVLLASSSPTFERVELLENSADFGGGAYLYQSSPVWSNTRVQDNMARVGAGLYLFESSPTVLHAAFLGNDALESGGGIYLYLSASKPRITSSLFGWNAGGHLHNGSVASPAAPAIKYCAFFTPFGQADNLAALDTSNVTGEPGLSRYSPDGNGANDDLSPRSGSVLVDAGDPAVKDLNGSRADIGIHGGPSADAAQQSDEDGDGLPDRWKDILGLTIHASPTEDLDADGLDLSQEHAFGTFPGDSDSDDDGFEDGVEAQGDGEPLDWYLRPGVSIAATAAVPGDFSNPQAAVNAMRHSGTIMLGSGVWGGSLRVAHKDLKLQGSNAILEGLNPGMTVLSSRVEILDLRISNGISTRGGGIYLGNTDATLSGLDLEYNLAEGSEAAGGALFAFESDVVLQSSRLVGNRAHGDGAHGGALALVRGSLLGRDLEIRSNQAGQLDDDDTFGGGIASDYSSVDLTRAWFDQNRAGWSGGAAFFTGEAVITQSRFTANSVEGSNVTGGAISLLDAELELTFSELIGNVGQGASGSQGGALHARNSEPTLAYVNLSENRAASGGAISLVSSGATLLYSTLISNEAALGGGIFISGDAAISQLRSAIISYNPGGNVYATTPESFVLISSYTDYFNPEGEINFNIPNLDQFNYVLEPELLSYASGIPSSPRLAADSELVDKGDEFARDPDGTRADCGAFGGPDADEWDLDGDGFPAWYWPGDWSDAPTGIPLEEFDCEDLNPGIPASGACPGLD